MKSVQFRNWLGTLCAFALIQVLFGASLFAQLPEPAQKPAEPGFFSRFSFGIRGSVLTLPIQNDLSETQLNSQADPPVSILQYSNNESKRYGGGPSLQFNINPKLSINADLLYRRLGYSSGLEVVTQPTDDDDSEFVSGAYQRTRADIWDVPVMLRYYRGPIEDEDGRRTFVAGGFTVRNVSGIKSFNETVDDEGLRDSNTIPATALRSTVPGITAGVGWQFRDEIGVKVDIEARVTRWLQRAFDSPSAQSNLNQFEIIFGLSF